MRAYPTEDGQGETRKVSQVSLPTEIRRITPASVLSGWVGVLYPVSEDSPLTS